MTIHDCLKFAENSLRVSGIESFEYDAQELLSYCLNVTRLNLLINKNLEVGQDCYKRFIQLIELRASRVPLQHITNHSYFYGLDLYVDKNVLIPRFETELLCEKAIEIINNQELSVLDLCTGSGCIAISIAKHCPNAKVTAIDVSFDAIKITEENAKRNNVSINCIQNNLLDNLENNFDIIISNPPYISKKDMASLQEEVKHDPQLALDGGNDGTDIIRRIIFDKSIKKNTILMLELGYDQAELVSNLMKPFYNNIEIIKDYCGINRFIIAEKGV